MVNQDHPIGSNIQSNGPQPMVAEEAEETKNWLKLVERVWADENLKQRLLDHPADILQEHGMKVPPGVEVRVVENTDKIIYLTLPAKPAEGTTELTSSQMAAVAGGRVIRITNVRVNATTLSGGSAAGATPVVA